MERRDLIILKKILSEIDIAAGMLGERAFEVFNTDEMLKRAICMTVINIGELVKGLSEEFRKAHRNVPWKDIAGFRDIAAHKYQTLRMDDVYVTVRDDFPVLARDITKILKEE